VDLLRHRRELNRGFGEALSRAFEFAVTTALFFVLGLLLDRWLGTTPLFMLVLTVFTLVGQFVRIWYAYDAEMRRHEAERKRVQGGFPE
jgi:F0F1-type ATP synthase assembly protein I